MESFRRRPISHPNNTKEATEFFQISSSDFTTRVSNFPVLQRHPYLVPTTAGHHVAILDSNSINHIADFRSDSLAPWNQGNFKSKQHCFLCDANTGNYRRADTKEDRERSNAKEYYCKHPIFKIIKRVFLAIDHGSVVPTKDTYIVFHYKIDEPNPSNRSFTSTMDTASQDEVLESSPNQIESMLDNFFNNAEIKPERSEFSGQNERSKVITLGMPNSMAQNPKRPSILRNNSVSPQAIKVIGEPAPKQAKIASQANGHPKPVVPESMSSRNGISKRHFGLFDPTPCSSEPPNVLDTPEGNYVDQAVKSYYYSNNLMLESYHTSFPFQLQKGADLNFIGKRRCAHCNAEISIGAETLVITRYEPYEFIIPKTNHISTSHGNRITCIRFSCLKARYPYIDRSCVLVSDSVTSEEAEETFHRIF